MKLLPNDYQQQLPANWKEYFSIPSPGPQGSRKGRRSVAASGTKSTGAISEGNPEFLEADRSSPPQHGTATGLEEEPTLREIVENQFSVNNDTVFENAQSTSEPEQHCTTEDNPLREIENNEYSVNTDTIGPNESSTAPESPTLHLRNIDEDKNSIAFGEQRDLSPGPTSNTTSLKSNTKRSHPARDIADNTDEGTNKRLKPSAVTEHSNCDLHSTTNKTGSSDAEYSPGDETSQNESDEAEDFETEDIHEELGLTVDEEQQARNTTQNTSQQQTNKTKVDQMVKLYTELTGKQDLELGYMPMHIAGAIASGNEFWTPTPTEKQMEEVQKFEKMKKRVQKGVPTVTDIQQKGNEATKATNTSFTARAFAEHEIFDYSGTHRLSAITFFIHQDNEVSLFCQPMVNHRKVMMSSLSQNFLPAAVETDPNAISFEDSIYVIPYEITEDETSGVPLYSAYNTENRHGNMELRKCYKQYAKYPSVGCVKHTLSFFGMNDLLTKHFSQGEQHNDDLLTDSKIFVDMLNHPLFMDIVYPCTNPFSGIKSFHQITSTLIGDTGSSSSNIRIFYRKIRSHILQNTKLRFAIMDGQHRVAISLHVLGGYKISNKFDDSVRSDNTIEIYNQSKDMKVNGKPAIRFILPKTRILDTQFTTKCIQASIEIIDRKLKAEGNPWRKVIYDALNNDQEKLSKSGYEYVEENASALCRFVFADTIYDESRESVPVMVSIHIWITKYRCQQIFRKPNQQLLLQTPEILRLGNDSKRASITVRDLLYPKSARFRDRQEVHRIQIEQGKQRRLFKDSSKLEGYKREKTNALWDIEL